MLSDDDRKFLTPYDYTMHSEERLAQIAAARRRSDARQAKADDLYTRYTDAWVAENVMLQLEEVVEVGLDPCYEGQIGSFLCDLCADFSWDEDSVRQQRSVFEDQRLVPVQEYFQKQFGFDIRGWLEQSIEQGKEFYANFEGFEDDGIFGEDDL